MDSGIVIAIVTGILSLAGVVVTSYSNRKKISADFQRNAELADARLDSQIQVINAHLENLGEEVRKHNSFGSRIPVLEEKVSNLEKRVANIEQR
jgi:endonuclease/exonuclease/phosphatase family metal-dependent hydrolase